MIMGQHMINNVKRKLTGHRKRDFMRRLAQVRIAKRQTLWIAQDGKCHYCGVDTIQRKDDEIIYSPEVSTLDHIISQTDGGTDHLSNLVMACYGCNYKRGNLEYHYFVKLINTPGAYDEHVARQVAANTKTLSPEKIRIQSRHRELVADQIQHESERKKQKLLNNIPHTIIFARKNNIPIPDDEDERIRWAIDYQLKRTEQ
jgi:5-methylcytosine-specific restriction endonuclease McrA